MRLQLSPPSRKDEGKFKLKFISHVYDALAILKNKRSINKTSLTAEAADSSLPSGLIMLPPLLHSRIHKHPSISTQTFAVKTTQQMNGNFNKRNRKSREELCFVLE
jgi:hypothetical protein